MPAERRANRLIQEKSPYLLQHAHNPVDWFPWGADAFDRALKENKPIFLSIGYSTCHWCHVMERESFENPAVAAVLNRHFVSIKVDREERPDVDRVYMTFVQSSTGSGGWPMSVFLTPDLRPFLGGTYFPPDDRYGRPGFVSVLRQIAEIWQTSPDKIIDQGSRFTEALAAQLSKVQETSSGPLTLSWLENGYRQFVASYDSEEGGFSDAPKFPRPSVLNFLLRYWYRAKSPRALEMADLTLRKMASGGIYDHLGGGFHRYSVDDRWHVPHFEKMLYDQAQLAIAYAELTETAPDPDLEQTLRETLDYVLRDLTSPEGGFYSAEDADSLPAIDATEKKEGAFYVWPEEELSRALSAEESLVFRRMYGVERAGNVVTTSDPHGELAGQNVLHQMNDRKIVAKLTGRTEAEVRELISTAKQKLFAIRNNRPRPHLDDKVVTAWNGLMISGLAKGFQKLGESRYLAAAQRAAGFLLEKLRTADNRLLRSYRGLPSAVNGFAEDYAFLIQGLLDLYESDFDIRWLKSAQRLQLKMNELFSDAQGGYFSTEAGAKDILFRLREDHDGAEPSANSVAAMNLVRLGSIFDREDFRYAASRLIGSFHASLDRMPAVLPQMLAALDAAMAEPVQIVLAGSQNQPETMALLREIRNRYLPNKVVILADGGEDWNWLTEQNTGLRMMTPVEGRPAAYVCRNFTCELPVTEVDELAKILARA
ncbi:MAG TPA: thioredoxin domain-containing protein [Chthoniobacterales bacterium]|jgi:uncharacterized protein YyaL (SSP411 family)|nr:thioredoxin domain-containing protein [Chthoniobacterales bacterium]